MRHQLQVEELRLTAKYCEKCLLWAWRFTTEIPLQENTCLGFSECYQWTAFSY